LSCARCNAFAMQSKMQAHADILHFDADHFAVRFVQFLPAEEFAQPQIQDERCGGAWWILRQPGNEPAQRRRKGWQPKS
ncbi:MAG TPA: hypothetical protein VLN59_12680, partial [Burkholderiales bacterium]|nr:hypothetical protein [Burkholderiales bacterium]